MKKGLLILMAVAMLPFISNAQNWLTVKGGGGLALIMGAPDTDPPGISINSGVGYKHQMTNRFMLEGDILLDTRSIDYYAGVDAKGEKIYLSSASTYLQIPITAHYNWLLQRKELIPYRDYDSKTNFYVEGGPYFGYGLNVSNLPNPDVLALWASSADSITTANQEPNNIDVGVTGGFGFSYEFKNMNKVNFGARLYYGLLNMHKDAKLGTANNMSAVGHISFDFSLTDRRHIKHRW